MTEGPRKNIDSLLDGDLKEWTREDIESMLDRFKPKKRIYVYVPPPGYLNRVYCHGYRVQRGDKRGKKNER